MSADQPLDLSDAGFGWCGTHQRYEWPDTDHEEMQA